MASMLFRLSAGACLLAGTAVSEQRYSPYAQDHWTALRTLTLDYGLRYEDNHLPSPLPQHALNFSPRLGLAWSPISSLTIRSGFGLFYDRFLLSTLNRLLEFNGTRAFSTIAEGSGASAIYNGLGASSSQFAPSIWRANSTRDNSYSEVASLGVEEALPWRTTVKGEYQFVRGLHLGRTTNANLLPPVLLTSGNAASLGIPAPTPQQLGSFVFSPGCSDPAYDTVNQFSTTAGSSYHGVTITANRQFTDDLQVLAGYTFSKTLDDASYDTEQPQNPSALGSERALSLQDQRHRLTLSGLWLIGPDLGDPQDAVKNANPGPLLKMLYGLEFAPILSMASGFRANPLIGVDSNLEHVYPFAARPRGYSRNAVVTPSQINLDFRVLRMVALGPGHLDVVAESFNLLNHQNIGLLNTTFGSGLAASPGFGRPVSAFPARKVQFSLDYEF